MNGLRIKRFDIRLVEVYVLDRRAAHDNALYQTFVRVVCDVKRIRTVRKSYRELAARYRRGERERSARIRYRLKACAVERSGNAARNRVDVFDLVSKGYVAGNAVSINGGSVFARGTRNCRTVSKNRDGFARGESYGKRDIRSEFRFAVFDSADFERSVRVVPRRAERDGRVKVLVYLSRIGRERVLGEGNISRSVTATKHTYFRFSYRG